MYDLNFNRNVKFPSQYMSVFELVTTFIITSIFFLIKKTTLRFSEMVKSSLDRLREEVLWLSTLLAPQINRKPVVHEYVNQTHARGARH